MAKEFKQFAANIRIIVKNAPVEAYHSVEMIEKYHESLRRVYFIIITEIPGIELNFAFQMSFKAMNNLIRLNELVYYSLLLAAYCKIIELNASSPWITQRAMAMKKRINKISKCSAFWQVNDGFDTCNKQSTASVHDGPINSPVLIYWEKKDGQSEEWKESYKFLSVQGKSVIIKPTHGPIRFKSSSIKLYLIDDQEAIPDRSAFIQVFLAKASLAEISLSETHQTKTSLVDTTIIKPAAQSSLAI